MSRRCRDCADHNGICPHDGTPCDPREQGSFAAPAGSSSDGLADCPMCDRGEVYQPTAVPDAEPWETCPCCNGTAKLPSPEQISELRKELWAALGDLQAAAWELEQLKSANAPANSAV